MPDWEPRPKHLFTHLAGVPVGYDRMPPHFPYGQRVDIAKQRAKPFEFNGFNCKPEFNRDLDACFANLWAVCPLGKADQILSAGAYTAKPKEHGKGQAFDLDGIIWPSRTFVALRYKEDPKFYLAVDAVLRMHFAQVLDFHYPQHADHFHLDHAPAFGFNQDSVAECGFVQAALREVFGFPVPQTGAYDLPLREALHKLNAGDLRNLPTWRAFLYRVVVNGFEGEGA